MSIMPMPDLQAEPEGIHLSALDAYIAKPGTLTGVGFWPRAGARIIDQIIHYLIAICSGFLFGALLRFVAALRHTSVRGMLGYRKLGGIALYIFALLASVAFQAICEGIHGSSPGKRLFSMVVVQEDGSRCRHGSAWIRSFAYFIDSLFFGLIGYFSMEKTPQQQRHGDEWAHTIVYRRSDVAAQNQRSMGQFTLALFLAILAYSALMILGMLVNLMG